MIMKIRGKVNITASELVKVKEAFFTYKEKTYLSFSVVVSKEGQTVQKGAYPIKKHGSPSIKLENGEKYWVGDLSCTNVDMEYDKVALKFTMEKKWIDEIVSPNTVFSAKQAKNGKTYADLYFSVEFDVASVEKNQKIGVISLKTPGENKYTELGQVKFSSFLQPAVQEVSETIIVQEEDDLPF